MASERVELSLTVEGRREVERELSRVDRALDEVGRGLRELDGDADAADRGLRELARDGDRSMRALANDVDRSMSAVGRDLRGIGSDTDRASRDLRGLANDADRAATDMQGAFDSLSLPDLGGGLGSLAGGGLTALAAAPLIAVANREGLGQLPDDVLFGLTDRALEQATAARLGIDPFDTGSLIRRVGGDFPTLEATDIAEALIAVAENAPLADPADLARRVGLLGELEMAGLGDSAGIALSTANAAAAFGTDFDTALDTIVGAFQSGANRQGDLLDTLTEYANNVGGIGLSLEDFANQLVQGSDPSHGLYNLDKVGDALRELGNQIRTGGDEVNAGLEALGLTRDGVEAAFASGRGREAFGDIVDGLQELQGTARGESIASDLFGAPYEDLGSGLLDVLDLTESRLGDIEGAAQSASDTIAGGLLTQLASGTLRNLSSGFFNPGDNVPLDLLNTAGRSNGAAHPRPAGSLPVGIDAFTTNRPAMRSDTEAALRSYLERPQVVVNIDSRPVIEAGVVTQAGNIRSLFDRYAQDLTRTIERSVQRSTVFGGRTEGTQ